MICDECNGDGLVPHHESFNVCPKCEGRGTIEGPESEQERRERVEEERGDALREEQIYREQSEGYDL